jgi:hypothetical protein
MVSIFLDERRDNFLMFLKRLLYHGADILGLCCEKWCRIFGLRSILSMFLEDIAASWCRYFWIA